VGVWVGRYPPSRRGNKRIVSQLWALQGLFRPRPPNSTRPTRVFLYCSAGNPIRSSSGGHRLPSRRLYGVYCWPFGLTAVAAGAP
jgi:hypothetical protein